mmetsp:Transcript_20900/g.72096  ORF Transcript_20900/g.72096 Transcript_20900/m.72096 type:complete len:259 (-) Transcript_20900:45-821(-)
MHSRRRSRSSAKRLSTPRPPGRALCRKHQRSRRRVGRRRRKDPRHCGASASHSAPSCRRHQGAAEACRCVIILPQNRWTGSRMRTRTRSPAPTRQAKTIFGWIRRRQSRWSCGKKRMKHQGLLWRSSSCCWAGPPPRRRWTRFRTRGASEEEPSEEALLPLKLWSGSRTRTRTRTRSPAPTIFGWSRRRKSCWSRAKRRMKRQDSDLRPRTMVCQNSQQGGQEPWRREGESSPPCCWGGATGEHTERVRAQILERSTA